MRKISYICSLLLIAVTMTAQISFWYSRPIHMIDTIQQIMYDSIESGVRAQYDYSEVDSIRYDQSTFDGVYRIYVFKNGQTVFYPHMMVVNDSNAKKSYYYEQGYAIDSIVWHPYALKNAEFPYVDTVPVLTLYGENEHTYAISLEPLYASFTSSVSSSDESVVQASMKKLSFNEATQNYSDKNRLFLVLTTNSIGKATITVSLDNTINKQFNIVVSPRPNVYDETSISVDSLFNKIYSRLVVTGNQHPVGDPEITGVDEGNTGFFRTMFGLQELGADQLYFIWDDQGIKDIRSNYVETQNVISEAFFHRLYYNIWMCNSYLARTEGQAALALNRAEVRFLRAYFYYYLLDMFGNVPIVTSNEKFLTTPQSTRKQVYEFVESELLTVEPELSVVGYKPDYYRVDKAAAWLLLSRLYLNAPVYYSANSEYNKAAQYAYKVIQSSYDLASNYKWLFMGDNDRKSQVNDAWKEIIFPIRQEGKEHSSYCGSICLVAFMSDRKMPPTGIEEEWHCYRSRPQLLELFFDDPENAGQGTAEQLTIAAADDRARFCNSYNGQEWNSTGGGYFNYDFYACWGVQKWSNWYAEYGEGVPAGSDQKFPDTDVPLMRKAEAYLNYAEAVLRGGSTIDGVSAVDAVNVLRRRAHATELQTITLSDILDERGREFYAEGHRRSDLIRFGKYGGTNGYLWEMKGGEPNGADFPAYLNLYPIPEHLLPAMFQGVQNPGY